MLSRSLALVLVAFAITNGLLFWFVESQGLAVAPIEIQTRAMYEARVDAFFAQGYDRTAVFIGDSLVFGAHLRDTLADSWARATLSSRFVEAAKETGHKPFFALNLGVNGVLFSELQCMARDALQRRPQLLVLNLSPRPFSTDFRVPTTKTERAFLCAPATDSLLGRMKDEGQDALRAAVPVLRYRDLLQFRWLETTPRQRLLQLAHSPSEMAGDVGAGALDPDEVELAEVMREMAWRTKAAARYNAIRVTDDHPQNAALESLLGLMASARDTQVVIFYLRENVALLEGQLDVPHYEAESAKFVARVQKGIVGSHVRFIEVPAESLMGHFTDHIHLDAEGYAMLARTLAESIQ